MQRRKFLKLAGTGAVAVAATSAAASTVFPAKTPEPTATPDEPFTGLPKFKPRKGYEYRWIRTDRIVELLDKGWNLVTEFDMEIGLKWPHVGGLHLVRKLRS